MTLEWEEKPSVVDAARMSIVTTPEDVDRALRVAGLIVKVMDFMTHLSNAGAERLRSEEQNLALMVDAAAELAVAVMQIFPGGGEKMCEDVEAFFAWCGVPIVGDKEEEEKK